MKEIRKKENKRRWEGKKKKIKNEENKEKKRKEGGKERRWIGRKQSSIQSNLFLSMRSPTISYPIF